MLPVLYGDRFVARFEPVRDKDNGAVVIKNWWWEDGVEVSESMCASLGGCLVHFRDFLGMEKFRVEEGVELDWLPDGS